MIFGKILEYKRFAVHDGDGIRTTLFLKGCPLACKWCHNPEGIGFSPELAYFSHKCIGCGECAVCEQGAHRFSGSLHDSCNDLGHELVRDDCKACGKCAELCLGGALTFYGRTVSAESAARELLVDRAFFETSGGGVTLSGGEPLMQPEFTAEVFRLVKAAGVNTALDTCGYAPRESLERVLEYTDTVLFDIKAVDSELHKKYTGRGNALIHENLRYISSRRVPIEIRIPLIPGVNDREAEAMAALLSPLDSVKGVRVLPYHKYSDSKYASLGLNYPGARLEPPTDELLADFKTVLINAGLNVLN